MHGRRFLPRPALAATALLLAGCAPLPPASTPADDAQGGARSAGPGPAAPATAETVRAAQAVAPATPPTAAAPSVAATPATPGATPAVAPAATPGAPSGSPGGPQAGPPPFASVIKDARRIDGPLTLWQKEDKVWIELEPAQFNQPFLLSPKIKSGIGQGGVLGGLMALPFNGAGGAQVVEFVRVHRQVRLQARNTEVLAKAGTPEARAVEASYSHSLLGAVALASQPHPDRKSVLIEANALFLADVIGVGGMLQRGLRQGYGLDRNNTIFTAVRGSPQAVTLETQSHWFTGSVGGPPGAAAPPGAPVAAPPQWLPDTRSLLVGLSYSLAPLPAQPMPTRAADPRVGLFNTTVLDFSNDTDRTPRQRHVTRWRLEKKDPAAEFSEPVQPITFWIDRNVPLAYRETVRSAILEWNKAFEKIGFRGAIQVQQQPDDAAFDTLDLGYASVRWMMNASPSFGAIGPSHIDPRTGEILDADIAIEGLVTRGARQLRAHVLAAPVQAAGDFGARIENPYAHLFDSAAERAARLGLPLDADAHAHCRHAALAAEQLGYAMDVLQARGELDADGPLAEQFVQDHVKEVVMHEVGHALGLRHNFRASRAYTEAQLADAEFTRAHGTTGSVMEYTAVNLPRPGQPGGVPFQTTLGPYDHWAIEYAYKPLPADLTPQAQRAELQRIAARGSEPLLAFGTDEDFALGLDPESLQGDLGDDPLAFAAKRLEIARDLFQRQESRELPADQDYTVLRRSLGFAVNDAARALAVLTRQIGGVRTLRDYPGSGRDPLQPVDAAVQRAALDQVARAALAGDGLRLSPALQRRLAPDFLHRADNLAEATDFALPQRLLELQRAVLNHLLSDALAARVQDSASKTDPVQRPLALAEIYQRVARDVWSELGPRGRLREPIAVERRELQRSHVNRLAAALLRGSTTVRADARGLMREQARELLARLQAAQRGALDADTRVHLADSIDSLRQALSAPMQRLGY